MWEPVSLMLFSGRVISDGLRVILFPSRSSEAIMEGVTEPKRMPLSEALRVKLRVILAISLINLSALDMTSVLLLSLSACIFSIWEAI